MAQVYPLDGSIGVESEDFVLVPLPNALQPDFIDLFIIDRMGTAAQPQLRLNDGTWSDLTLNPGPENIWQSSYVWLRSEWKRFILSRYRRQCALYILMRL